MYDYYSVSADRLSSSSITWDWGLKHLGSACGTLWRMTYFVLNVFFFFFFNLSVQSDLNEMP